MGEAAVDLSLRAYLKQIRDRGEKALGLFLTSGFPEPEATLPLLHALDEAGADFIELGMPFSDPLAEGLPIQRASERALRHGTTMADTLATARSFCAVSKTPLVLMGYVNPILRYGIRAFCEDAAACGVSGLILPDLPPQESDLVADVAAESGLALTFLIAPNTPDDRVRLVDGVTTGFVYAVSQAGVTGGSIDRRDAVFQYLQRARRLVHNNPLLVGFGIRTPADVAALSAAADGCIVGSAIIDRAGALWDDSRLTTQERLDAIGGYVRSLKDAFKHLSE